MGLRTWPIAKLLLSVSLLAGCAERLPDQVPYQVTVTMAESEPNDEAGRDAPRRASRLLLGLAGAELVADGTSVGTLAWKSGMKATFTRPRSVSPFALRSKLALRVMTVCGPQTFPLVPRTSSVDISDESQLAKRIKERGFAELYVALPDPGATEILVDRGSRSGALRVGAVDIADSAPRTTLVFGACPAEQPITIDGAAVGVAHKTTPADLVSFDAGACYRTRRLASGEDAGAPVAKDLRGARVYALEDAPSYFLENAPDAAKAKATRTPIVELTRVACP